MGLLSGFINSFKNKIKQVTRVTVDKYSRSAPFRGDTWDNDVFRATVDAIATHAAKGKAIHVVMDTKTGHIKQTVHNSEYARLINERPNPLMSGTDFKYRMISNLETYTTAIAYIRWEMGHPKMIIPLNYKRFQFLRVDGSMQYVINFTDENDKDVYLPLEDCVVLRKFYNTKLAGGDGNTPIYKVFDMSKASDEGFIEALEVSNKVRGIHKHKVAMLNAEDVAESQKKFNERFDLAAKNGGVISVDSTEDYTPIQINPYSANASQMDRISKRIHSFLRTSEEIVLSKYTESQGLAWYESVIEPLWDILSESLTNAFFTSREIGYGNKIIFSRGIMMGTSYQTRNTIIASVKDLGLLTINEMRELLGYEPIEGGDIRQVSLNYINADDQSAYQTGKQEPDSAEPSGEDTEGGSSDEEGQ